MLRTARPLPPVRAEGPPLVANTTPFPGPITCDLIPKGWAVRLKGTGSEQELYDPALKNPGQYRALTYTMVLRPSELKKTSKGLISDRTDVPWGSKGFEGMGRAGNNEAVIFPIKDSDGKANPHQYEVYVRQGKTNRLVVLSNYSWPLALDPFTLRTMAGSCHYK